MLYLISTQLQKLDILNELKSDVSDLKNSVEHNNALIEEIKKENKTLKREVAHLQSKRPFWISNVETCGTISCLWGLKKGRWKRMKHQRPR